MQTSLAALLIRGTGDKSGVYYIKRALIGNQWHRRELSVCGAMVALGGGGRGVSTLHSLSHSAAATGGLLFFSGEITFVSNNTAVTANKL